MGLTCKRLKSTCETFVYLCVDETNYLQYRTDTPKSNGLEPLGDNSQGEQNPRIEQKTLNFWAFEAGNQQLLAVPPTDYPCRLVAYLLYEPAEIRRKHRD